MVVRRWWLSLSFLAACFSPQFQDSQIKCGPTDECPPGLSCMDGVCRSGNGGGTEFPLTITLGGNGMGTVTSSPAGIDCGAACSEQVPSGTMVTLTATPESGSTFVGWSGACSGTDACTVTVDAAITVTASFALHNSLIVVLAGDGSGHVTSSPAGIDCGTQCSHQYPPNTTVTLTASSDAGSSFAGWSGGGCSGTGSCAVTVGASQVVTATFSKTLYALTVTRTGSGTGTVTSAPAGIDCGSDCTEPYGYNDMVTLTATPDANSVFAGWTGGGCMGMGACVVTVTTSTNVAAQFTARHTLTVVPTGGGSGSVTSTPSGINCGVDCNEVYTEGQTVTLTPSAAQGSTFAGWSGCDSVTGNVCTVMMTADKTVHATFATATFTLSVSASPSNGGDVTSTTDNNINCGATCSATYAFNATVSLAATARLGFVFSNWSGACTGSMCTVTMNANKSVTAMFQSVPTFALTVTKSGTGSGRVTSNPSGIDCGTDCNETYNNNTMVVLSAMPALGSTFDGWTGACTNTTGACTVTMTQARSVNAKFSAIPPNYVFVTSTTQTGNLGGLSGADAICQARADAVSLPGHFRAFLSTSTVDAINRFGTARGWIRTDGKPFLDKLTDFTTSHVLYPVRLDETGHDVGSDLHFTGTSNLGTLSIFGSCNDWTSASSSSSTSAGFSDANSHEVAFGASRYCSNSLRLLCLGYDNDAVVTVPPVSARRAFMTDGYWTPGGGLSSADATCQAEAGAAGLTGTYLALLPTSTASAISRFATGTASLPWARLDNTLLAPTAAALATSSTTFLGASPNGDAANTQWWAAETVWGGGVSTLTDVAAAANTCNDWTSSSSTITVLVGDAGATLIQRLMGLYNTRPCNDPQTHLICLQQ